MFAEPPIGFQLITPDLRGHGHSTNPSPHFRFQAAARDVMAIVEHLGLSRIKALGVSGGGIALLHMAIAQPAIVESMVIVSAPRCYPEQARAIQRQFSPQMLPEAEMMLMRQRHAHGAQQIDRLFEHVRAFAEDREDVNFTPAMLQRITAETLLVFGDRDPLYPVSTAIELYAALPRAFLWVMPNAGHAPVFAADAARFTAGALPFLRGEWRR
jgi:pimeloyl-ACP methyl ester carboxylesterase